MEERSEANSESEAKKRAEAKTALLLAVIFGGLIAVLIAGMMAIDIYAEQLQGSTSQIKDAPDP